MIAIGPVCKEPSWQWVGLDTIKELSKYFAIEIFNNYRHLPKSRIILIIKKIPPDDFMKNAKQEGKDIIYCPIDYFESPKTINLFGHILHKCSIILSHADSLVPIFKSFAPSYLVEHNGKYKLPEMATYKKEGYVLWVGGYQFVPYLLQYLQTNPHRFKLKLLTDYKKKNAIGRANSTARLLGIQLNTKHLEMYDWSKELQEEMMRECKASIDIKGDTFAQRNKPPTKGQKYITSGIPFAINNRNNCYNYFKDEGFNICTPDDEVRWMSEQYWLETQEFGKHMSHATSIEEVGKTYLKYILSLLRPEEKQGDGIGFIVNRVEKENLEHIHQD